MTCSYLLHPVRTCGRIPLMGSHVQNVPEYQETCSSLSRLAAHTCLTCSGAVAGPTKLADLPSLVS